jgi:hypothetical protein
MTVNKIYLRSTYLTAIPKAHVLLRFSYNFKMLFLSKLLFMQIVTDIKNGYISLVPICRILLFIVFAHLDVLSNGFKHQLYGTSTK